MGFGSSRSSFCLFFNFLSRFKFEGWAASSVAILISCGGGSVQFNERSYDNLRISPEPVLAKIAASLSDPATTRQILIDLAGKDSYRFDWPLFWDQLGRRPFAKDLYRRHSSDLIALHIHNCASFTEYTSFLLSVEGDIAPVVSESRQCDVPLRPEVAMNVARRLTSEPSSSADAPKNALQFLVKELGKGSRTEGWTLELTTQRAMIEKIGRQLIARDQRDVYFDAIFAFRQHLGESSYPESFVSDLTGEMKSLRVWLSHFAEAQGIRILSEILTENRDFRPTSAQLKNVIQAVIERIDALSDSSFPSEFADAVTLVNRLGAKLPLATRLETADSLLASGEARLARIPSAMRSRYVVGWLSKYRGRQVSPYFEWLALRQRVDQAELRQLVVHDLQESADPSDDFLFIVRSVARMFIADDPIKSAELAESVCRLFKENHIDHERRLSSEELVAGMPRRLPAGCYELPTGKLEIRSKVPFTTSFAAIVHGVDEDFSIDAPSVSLGPVYLSSTKRLDPLVGAPSPAEANASAFPLLLGVRTVGDTTFFQKGTHFFLYHHAFRQASPGEKETARPADGIRGPDISIRANSETAPFPFLSVGGAGQPGASARSGGRASTSKVDFEAISDWANLLFDNGTLKVEGPMQVEGKMNLELLENLFSQASRTADGKIEVFTIPGYVHRLDFEEKTKLVMACVSIRSKPTLTDGEIESCFVEDLVPAAAIALEATLIRSQSDGSLSRSTIFPALNPYAGFELPAGPPGPSNPDGARGKPGTARIFVNGVLK